MNTYELMEAKKDSFTKNELLIYNFIKENAYDVFRGNIVEMAKHSGVSQPAVTRFCKKIGYDNFSDFKMNLYKVEKEGLAVSNNSNFNYPILSSYTDLIAKIDGLLNSKELSKLAKSIAKARRVFVVGTHKSRLAAELFQLNVYKFGINCNLFTTENSVELTTLTNQDDLVLIISAYSEHYKDLTKDLYSNNVPIALLTMNNKPINKHYYKHFIWLPNHKNQNEVVYTENTVLFSIAIDILTSFIALEVKN